DGRDQRLILFAPAAVELPALVRGDAGRLRLRREGRALSQPQQEAPRLRAAAGELLRVGRARAGGEARADPLAAPATARLRRGAPPSLLRNPAADDACSGTAGGHTRSAAQTRRASRRRRRSTAALRARGAARDVPRSGVS